MNSLLTNNLLIITVIVFLCFHFLAKKVKSPFFNSLVLSVIILMILCFSFNITYPVYKQQVHLINDLLPYSVIALAYPLYELLPEIKKQWKMLFSITFIASVLAMLSGVFFVWLLGGNEQIAASILPKSVTTAIAVTLSEQQSAQMHTLPSITAFSVIFAGLIGSLFGYPVLTLFKIKSAQAKGLAMGSSSHALGTAKAAETSLEDGAFSALAMVLCGIFTAVLAPFIYPLLVLLF